MIFDEYLLGHWTNRSQAQSNPHKVAQTEVIWAKEGDWYTSLNFYRVDGPHKPYRNKKHKIEIISDKYVIMQNYRLDGSRHEECDMHFRFESEHWSGKLDSDKCRGEKGVQGCVRNISLRRKVIVKRQGIESTGQDGMG